MRALVLCELAKCVRYFECECCFYSSLWFARRVGAASVFRASSMLSWLVSSMRAASRPPKRRCQRALSKPKRNVSTQGACVEADAPQLRGYPNDRVICQTRTSLRDSAALRMKAAPLSRTGRHRSLLWPKLLAIEIYPNPNRNPVSGFVRVLLLLVVACLRVFCL